jgi:hypothetical protein
MNRCPSPAKAQNIAEPKWFERLEYYAFRITLLILFIAALIKLVRNELGW